MKYKWTYTADVDVDELVYEKGLTWMQLAEKDIDTLDPNDVDAERETGIVFKKHDPDPDSYPDEEES